MRKKLAPLDSRIPKWNKNDLLERSCPICNTPPTETKYERPDGLCVRTCNKCKTRFISPAPSNKQLRSFYQRYDEKHRRGPTLSKKSIENSYKGINPLFDLRIRKISSLMKIESSRVLDIGFGKAFFLYCLKKAGAITYGVDLDRQAIEFARHLGIKNVFHGSLDEYSSETKFNMISLIDLIEHPIDPMFVLRKSYELLEIGGYLLIWTPNGAYSKPENDPISFRVDLEHMQYLTTESCIYIASELNLKIVHLETLGAPSLGGNKKPLTVKQRKISAEKFIKSIPGFYIVKNIYNITKEPGMRSDSYNLFCIMQKRV